MKCSDWRADAWSWLVGDWQWPAAALFTSGFLFMLTPIAGWFMGIPVALVLLQLPLYMVHQFEEHGADRFRAYMNRMMAQGRDALTRPATFWINSIGVWGVIAFAFYAACLGYIACGLLAAYFSIINALIHIATATARRDYNPGLWTAIALLLPAGALCAVVLSASADAGWDSHVLAAGTIVLLHVGIMAHIVRSAARLARYPADQAAATVQSSRQMREDLEVASSS
jgi:hypothetical protein